MGNPQSRGPVTRRSARPDDDQIGNLQRPVHSQPGEPAAGEAEEGTVRFGQVEEGIVAEPGRVEPAGGGVYKEVQRGDEAAEAGVVESVHGDGQPWGSSGELNCG